MFDEIDIAQFREQYGRAHDGMTDREILFGLWSDREDEPDLRLQLSEDYRVLDRRYPHEGPIRCLLLYRRLLEDAANEGVSGVTAQRVLQYVRKALSSESAEERQWGLWLLSVVHHALVDVDESAPAKQWLIRFTSEQPSENTISFAEANDALEALETAFLKQGERATRGGLPLAVAKPAPIPLEQWTYAQLNARYGIGDASPYRTDGLYALGDALDHPAFGRGYIVLVTGPRITVNFPDRSRRLLCGFDPARIPLFDSLEEET